MAILPRLLAGSLNRALGLFPAVVVTGARQTGKSTLVRSVDTLAARRYLTLDAATTRALALAEPAALLADGGEVTIDEIQRVPELLLAIKEVIDADRTRGRFVLTGSANLLLMNRVSESLAGRARYLTLWPMTRREQLGAGDCGAWSTLLDTPRAEWLEVIKAQAWPYEAWQDLAVRGGYPDPALTYPARADDAARAELFEGYVQTYLERDLRDLAAIDNLYDFRRLMRATCLRIGNIVHQAELARDTGLQNMTVHRYLNLLEVSYQLVRIEPYSVTRTKRLVKSPKMYWSDTGLAIHLAGGVEPSGAHLENIVLTDLLAWRETDTARPGIMYWRTVNGDEVDFVIERNGRLLAIEVKATTNPGHKDARSLRTFLAEYGSDVAGGLLLHGGEDTFWISEGVLAVPWWQVM